MYDGGKDAMALRERGLFLCSNRVSLQHPYFNTKEGRREWNLLNEEEKYNSGMLHMSDEDIVMVTASIPLPNKFHHFLDREEERALKFPDEDNAAQ